MTSEASITIIKMLETLPEQTQDRVIDICQGKTFARKTNINILKYAHLKNLWG
jgi:hypothetical protein